MAEEMFTNIVIDDEVELAPCPECDGEVVGYVTTWAASRRGPSRDGRNEYSEGHTTLEPCGHTVPTVTTDRVSVMRFKWTAE